MAYKAKMQLWHTGDNRYVQPGEMVDLSHLDEAKIAKLIEIEAVMVVEGPVPTFVARRPKSEEGQG